MMEKLSACPVCDSSEINHSLSTKVQMQASEQSFNFDNCNNCGLVFLNPRVSEKSLHEYYPSYYLPYRGPEAWGKYSGVVEAAQRKMNKKRTSLVKRHFPLTSDSVVLDIGCGKPSFLKQCVEELHVKGMGIDFTDEGWKSVAEEYNQLELMVGEVKELPKDLKPDVITMWHYLEHDYHPLNNLIELRKRAKADTHLIIEVPNYDSVSRKKFGEDWAGYHTPRHTSLFSPKNIQVLLNKSGWQIEKTMTYGSIDAYLIYWMSRMEKKGFDWSSELEKEFIPFVKGMLRFIPMKLREKKRSMGIMTVIARAH